ncbi:MAG: hypothetical protein ABIH00_10715 [Armatimonadota bacterium]
MKKLLITIITITLLSTTAFAASTDTQTIYYEIDSINELTLSAESLSLTMSTATAGDGLDPAIDNIQYSLSTNETSKKITGVLNSTLSNMNLFTNLTAPACQGNLEMSYS